MFAPILPRPTIANCILFAPSVLCTNSQGLERIDPSKTHLRYQLTAAAFSASPNDQIEAPRKTTSLSRNCPGIADSAGNPKLGSPSRSGEEKGERGRKKSDREDTADGGR